MIFRMKPVILTHLYILDKKQTRKKDHLTNADKQWLSLTPGDGVIKLYLLKFRYFPRFA